MYKQLLFFFALCIAGFQAMAKSDDEGKAVFSGKISTLVESSQGKKVVEGQVNGFLRMDPVDFDRGLVRVGALNLVYHQVPQTEITGIDSVRKMGSLGFTVDSIRGESYQTLVYEPQSLTLSGELSGSISLSQYNELVKREYSNDVDDYDGLSQPARIKVMLQLDKPLDTNLGSNEILKLGGKFGFEGVTSRHSEYDLPELKLVTRYFPVDLEISWLIFIEVAKRLCIQPVRIGTLSFSNWPPVINIHYSGDGLNFGMPGANTEWSKADIVFTVRDWITRFASSFSTLSSTEVTPLFDLVDEPDCAEVFFVDRFSPSDMFGGGATTAGGSIDTKIVSSDENADFGIDLTHLAHELGHALTLKHPGQGFPTASQPHRIDGSSGTLMCPSGFMNDNPQVNSQWNKDSVQNPLLTFALKLLTANVDCQNDADCGACP